MIGLSAKVESAVKDKLKRKVMYSDGWVVQRQHPLRSTFCCPSRFEGERRLFHCFFLSFSPLYDETNLNADKHCRFIKWVVQDLYGKNVETDVISIIGDNFEANKSIARKLGKTLVGCGSHRLNLAIKIIPAEHKIILDKVNTLMGKFENLILGTKLRKLTSLVPVQRNVTRWSSTFEMIKRYFELKTLFSTIENDPALAVYLPAPFENNLLENLLNQFTKLNSVNKAMQHVEITISDTRALFDEVIKSHPMTSKYLASDASIVFDVVFESAITKIQNKNERFMTKEEVLAVKMLKKNEDEQASATSTSDDFAQSIIKKKRMCNSGSDYATKKEFSMYYLRQTLWKAFSAQQV